jgi:hypothetical protein
MAIAGPVGVAKRVWKVQHVKDPGSEYKLASFSTSDYSLICGTSYTAQMSAGRW